MSGLDQDVLKHALSTARDRGFRKVVLQSGGERFKAILGDDPVDSSSFDEAGGDSTLEIDEPGPREVEIVAPVVGYLKDVHQALAPGRTVTVGDIVCEIVALGIPNDVVSNQNGEIVEVLVGAGEAVEYGQVLAKLRTT